MTPFQLFSSLLAYYAMLYYNITMTAPQHHDSGPHHHHHPGRAHPPATVPASLLRMSALVRLAFAAALISMLWVAAFWAMR